MRDKHDSGATGDGAPEVAPRKPVTAREARLAAALRDNLRRRKAQARGRLAEQGEAPSTASGTPDGRAPSK
jgi:hypothetical protein